MYELTLAVEIIELRCILILSNGGEYYLIAF